MAYAFYLGIDIEEKEDVPVATLSLVEKSDETPAGEAADESVYYVRRIEQTTDLDGEDEDGEELEGAHLADRVQDMLIGEEFVGHAVVAVNRTSAAGQAALHALTERGLSPVGFALTGGSGAAQEGTGVELSGGDDAVTEGSGFFVAERTLAERLLRLERAGRLHLEQGNADDYVSKLAHGMQSYRAEEDADEASEGAETLGGAEAAADEDDAPGRVEAEGEATPDAVDEDADAPTGASEDAPRRHPHATLVVSAGMACWLGEERSFDPTEHLTGDPPTTGEAKRLHRPDTAS